MKPPIQPLRDGDPKNFQGWVLKGLIGEGGQSTIYLAEKNGKQAALKMIRKEFLHNEKSVERFFTEIKNLELLDHPSIASVLEVEDSGKFVAIDFIDGPNLEDYVFESGPFDFQKWCEIAQALANAIDFCHSKGIIHKDISPRNIVISSSGPVLIDFGISYLEKDPRLTSDGETIGTPPFMSPEHFGVSTSKAMDAFSLAGTLIFAATGHDPFSGETNSERRESILFNQPNFSGLSEDQVMALSPLLYKRAEDRGSLSNFSKIVQELASTESRSDFATKEFSKVRGESPKKLVQEKKQLTVKNQTIKRSVAVAAVVTLLSIGLVAFGIYAIQSNLGENKAQSSNTTGTSSDLTPDQIQKVSACKNFAAAERYDAAVIACREPADLGDVWAQFSLGYSLDELGNNKEAKFWVQKAADQRMPEALSWMAFDELDRDNYAKALVWAQQAADLGDLPGINALGITYGYLEEYDLAVKWYKKAWELGDVLGAINLGYHYRFDSINTSEATKWLKIAAEVDSIYAGETAFDYADFLRIEKKSSLVFCPWYKKSADAKFKDDENDGVVAFKKYCSNFVEVRKPAVVQSPNQVSPTPVSTKKPNPTSDSFKVSAPLAANVRTDEIFGRPFENGLNFWQISLTNVKGAKVPEITAVQFRMIGFANAGWMDVPYKLKTDTTFGSVYAEVDDILFALIFKDQKYCPEFRLVREEGGEIVHIWNKGQPDCATDYNP